MKRFSRSLLSLGLVLLVSLLAALPSFAAPANAVAGTAAIIKSATDATALAWARQGGSVTIQVTDTDLNVPIKKVLLPSVASDATALAGTVATTAGSTTLTGTGTAFNTALAVGNAILVGLTGADADEKVREVVSIASDGLSLTVNIPFANTGTGLSASKVNVNTANAAAGTSLADNCPDCAAARSITLANNTNVQTFALTDLFTLADTNVGVSLANRFSGSADSLLNVQDVRVVADADGSTIANLSVSVDLVNGNLNAQFSAQPGAAVAARVVYWTASSNTVGTPVAATTNVKVTSNADATGIGVVLTETGVSTGIFRKTINLTSADSVADTSLKVGLSDVVRLTYTDASPAGTSTASVVVETTAGTFSNLTPADNTPTQLIRPVVTGDITDADSGIDKTTIRVVVGIDANNDGVIDAGQASDLNPNNIGGTVGAITNGFGITQQLTAPTTDAQIFWWIKATDVAGNVGISDSDRLLTSTQLPDTCVPSSFPTTANLAGVNVTTTAAVGGCQPFTIKVDFTAPAVLSATTGRWWDTTKTTTDKTETTATKAKNTSVIARFNEAVDPASIAATDFTVDGVTPSLAEHFTGAGSTSGTNAAGCPTGVTGCAVFLTLATPLAADAKPVVKLVSPIKDLAGNDLIVSSTSLTTAGDGIAPTITASVSGTGTIPITKTGTKVTINFSTNEPASVDNASVKVNPYATTTTLGADFGTIVPTLVSAQNWKAELTVATAGRYSVFISANDLSANQGTKGVNPATATATLLTGTTTILFEFDAALAAPTVKRGATTLTATSVDVESDDPFFVTVDWTAEGAEYTCGTPPCTATGTDTDSHGNVTLTKLTLDGTDILSQVASTTATSFVAGIRNIALGNHTLVLNGTDVAGNKLATDVSVKFNVIARPQYSVALQPGMNLVSLPGAPADPSINTVLPSSLNVNSIVTYDPKATGGPWLVATRNTTTGLLEGTLTSIDGNHAYWIDSGTAQTLKVTIPKQGFQATPPAIAVIKGWNLVPVIDLGLSAQNTTMQADNYFASVSWVVAYTFDTIAGQWQRVLPKQVPAQTVKVGAGYWVYVTADGVLVP